MPKLYAMMFFPMSMEDDCDGVASVSVNALSDSIDKLVKSAEATMNEDRDEDGVGEDGLMVSRVQPGDTTYVQFKFADEPDEDGQWLTYFSIDEVEII